MAIEAFSNFSISISDGGTVPSLDYLSNKTYVNIGSGNILKISWNTPTATNNAVENYNIFILMYDSTSASYKQFYVENIGNVNEFYIKPELFSSVNKSFVQLRIYVEVISKYGAAYKGTSNIESVNVGRGCGVYVKVTDGYAQPIMKRALAFARINSKSLASITGAQIASSDGKLLLAKASNVQDETTGWTLMQEAYSRDSNGIWKENDLMYEVLTDVNGEIVTDQNDNAVYVL